MCPVTNQLFDNVSLCYLDAFDPSGVFSSTVTPSRSASAGDSGLFFFMSRHSLPVVAIPRVQTLIAM